MIRSMTGFGSAEARCGRWSIRVEARSVNQKDLRVSYRLPDSFRMKELELQKLIEPRIRRGHLYLTLECSPAGEESGVMLDERCLRGYVAAIKQVAESEGLPLEVDLAGVLRMPGVLVDVTTDEELREELWPAVARAVAEALDGLVAMRRAEGASLAAQLAELCEAVEGHVGDIEERQGDLVAEYRDRLRERLEKLLEGVDAPVSEETLARELAVYADRADVSEEVARLRSHAEQFRGALAADEQQPVGRKMDFLGQEMLREANTMAAKITAGLLVGRTLELKADIDRLREQARNVE